MGRFDSSAALAKRLIDLNGEDVTVTTFSATPADPTKPWLAATNASSAATTRAVFLNYDTADGGKQYANDTEVHKEVKKVLLAANGLTVAPSPQGTIERQDGTTFRMASVKLLDPGGQKVLYEIEAVR